MSVQSVECYLIVLAVGLGRGVVFGLSAQHVLLDGRQLAGVDRFGQDLLFDLDEARPASAAVSDDYRWSHW